MPRWDASCALLGPFAVRAAAVAGAGSSAALTPSGLGLPGAKAVSRQDYAGAFPGADTPRDPAQCGRMGLRAAHPPC